LSDAAILVAALRNPASVLALDASGWTALITIARAEQLIGTLAARLRTFNVPPAIAAALEDARCNAEYQRRAALWEADCARRALTEYSGRVVLMKGTAYVAAGLKAGEGRHIGDLDIMVAVTDLAQVERLLLEQGGWEWVKDNAYDDAYYRDHMHELPPMIHKERDRMIDVHHTILPLTARPTPDAVAMLADAAALENGLYVFSPSDMLIHSAAHLFADGELDGGLRNLWDIHCLVSEFVEQDDDFFPALMEKAASYGLLSAASRALRIASILYGTQLTQLASPLRTEFAYHRQDKWYVMRLTARDNWGRGTRKFIRLIFYIRSHWMRMPPLMLAAHLWTKWRKS
jgi:hypothetical protein